MQVEPLSFISGNTNVYKAVALWSSSCVTARVINSFIVVPVASAIAATRLCRSDVILTMNLPLYGFAGSMPRSLQLSR